METPHAQYGLYKLTPVQDNILSLYLNDTGLFDSEIENINLVALLSKSPTIENNVATMLVNGRKYYIGLIKDYIPHFLVQIDDALIFSPDPNTGRAVILYFHPGNVYNANTNISMNIFLDNDKMLYWKNLFPFNTDIIGIKTNGTTDVIAQDCSANCNGKCNTSDGCGGYCPCVETKTVASSDCGTQFGQCPQPYQRCVQSNNGLYKCVAYNQRLNNYQIGIIVLLTVCIIIMLIIIFMLFRNI